MAVQVIQPQRKRDTLGSIGGLVQAGAPLAALAFPAAAPAILGAGAGAGLLGAIRGGGQSQGPQLADTGGSIRRRLQDSPSRQQSLIALREAQEAIDLLPPEQQERYQRPIGLALQQV